MASPRKNKIKFLEEFRGLFNEKLRYIVYYGGRSSGKSYHVALALLLRGRSKKLRILCTREIQITIKDSVYKLLCDIIEKESLTDYRITKDSIINRVTGTEFIFKGLRSNIMEIKSTEGIDICWVEEAQSITQLSIDILTPTIRKKGSQLIFTFNRFNELDPVFVNFVMFKKPRALVKKVNYDVLESAGLLPDVIKLEIEADRENKNLFNHKWLGEPISQSESAVLDRNSVLDAMNRKASQDGAIIVGVDVARMGSDRTVFWKRKALQTIETKIYQQLRIDEIAARLEDFVNYDKTIEIKVDDTGVGGGLTDIMLQKGYRITPVNFAQRAVDNQKYPNYISEAWFNMREYIDEIGLPMDADLLMELTTRQWKQDVSGRRTIESKQVYKKRGSRSPDLADACIICYSESKPIFEWATSV